MSNIGERNFGAKKEIMLRAFQSMGVADAFGYPFEFCTPTTASVKRALADSTPIGITDDTQMALFGLEGLSSASTDGVREPETVCTSYILSQYLAWYETQSPDRSRKYSSWLSQQPLMRVSRAPGRTCMAALSEFHRRGCRKENNSKGNGAVMRCLPFVFAPWILGVTEEKASKLADMGGGLTHDHAESREAITIFMWLAFRLLRDGELSGRTVFDLKSQFPAHMSNIAVLTVKEICEKENTFTAMPALKAAITAVVNALPLVVEKEPTAAYESMLIECCANEGDSDTVAAIAGALWGLVEQPSTRLLARLTEQAIAVEAVSRTPIVEERALTSGSNIQAVVDESELGRGI